MSHLWEAEHPYHCNDIDYGGRSKPERFLTWGLFLAEWADADLDYNLLFRWDWLKPDQYPYVPGSDPYMRDGMLALRFFGQRKGTFQTVFIEVCQADEPAVREYLSERFAHLLKLWAPLEVAQ